MKQLALVSTLILGVVLTAPGAVAVQLDQFLSGLSSPLFVTGAGDGTNRLFVVQRGGIVKVVQPGSTTPTDFLNITGRVLSGGERGLLGLAFHPSFETNRRFYVFYTRQTDGALVISEFTVPALTPNDADEGTEVPLLTIPHPDFANHNGGMLAFGPDGFLYIGTGDGGFHDDPSNNAQNVDSLLGKILRLDVDTRSAPPDNPFVGSAGRDEIYAVGMRNPFRFSFDRKTGKLLAGDVGQNVIEEIDIVRSGGNYGWRVFEGTRCTGNDQALCANPSRYIKPIAEYSHTNGRCSITGGYVYRGTADAVPFGSYVFADFCTGEVSRLAAARRGEPIVPLIQAGGGVSSFGEDEAGEVYVVRLDAGTVQKLSNGCSYAVSASRVEAPASGFSGRIRVTSPPGCTWRAASSVPWITIGTGPRAQSGNPLFTVDPNTTGEPRVGTISLAGHAVTVVQD